MRAFLCGALVWVLVGCGTADVQPDEELLTQRGIGAEGGIVETGEARLTVPPAALATMVEIQVSASDESPEGYLAASRLFRFEPAGLSFAQPAVVELPFSGEPDGLALYWSNGDGGFDRVAGARAEGGVMRGEVSHFSFGFVGTVAQETEPVDEALCRRGGTCRRLLHTSVDKVDLLFMVDNSGSMVEEQQALVEEFPQMMRSLTTGDLDGDGTADFPGVRDLHVGVVSSDLGTVNIMGIPLCEGLGDNALLQQGTGGECPELPSFLSYQAGDDVELVASDFACLSQLGTEGCGFEQQLESVLKALWPSSDDDIEFVATADGTGSTGNGGTGPNQGFLRSDPEDPSLLAVVLVTDEEDCSASDTTLFTPADFLQPDDPLAEQDLNLRCVLNLDRLFPIDRYVDGLKALRPGNENLVLFAAITGVPPQLVSPSALSELDLSDDDDRERFYSDLLAHEAMQYRENPDTTPGNSVLLPSCENDNGVAYPPRRIVETARGFGVNGIVQSICQNDFAPAIDPILERMAAQLSGACLQSEIARDDDGRVACDLIWRFGDAAQAGDDSGCTSAPFLQPVDGANDVCLVSQLQSAGGELEAGDGWYLDDFSERARLCPGSVDQAIALSEAARVPAGVEVVLDCE